MSNEYSMTLTVEAAAVANSLLRQVALKGRSDTRLQARILREIKNKLFKVTHPGTDDIPERGKWVEGGIELSEEAFKFLRDSLERALDSGKPELPGAYAIGADELLDALDEARERAKQPKIVPIQPVEVAK